MISLPPKVNTRPRGATRARCRCQTFRGDDASLTVPPPFPPSLLSEPGASDLQSGGPWPAAAHPPVVPARHAGEPPSPSLAPSLRERR